MPKFTIEQTYNVPHYRHVTVEAENIEEAVRLANENQEWDSQKADFDCCGEERVTGIWAGEEAYSGPDLMEKEAVK